MAYVPERFHGPEFLSDRFVDPIKTFDNKAIIKQLMVSNVTNGLVRYEIYLASADQDAQVYNKIFPDLFVEKLNTEILDLALVVNPGDRIFAKANIPSSILLTISGVEVI